MFRFCRKEGKKKKASARMIGSTAELNIKSWMVWMDHGMVLLEQINDDDTIGVVIILCP